MNPKTAGGDLGVLRRGSGRTDDLDCPERHNQRMRHEPLIVAVGNEVLPFAILLMFLLPGCVGPLTQWGEEISLVSKAPSFSAENLEGKNVAILSAVVGFGLEGYSLQVSRSLSTALSSEKQAFTLVPIQTALSEINQHGLASDYAQMISEYTYSGILNRDILQRVGDALDVSYVFQPSMAAFSQFTSGRLSVLGLRIFHTRISILRLSVQLWDTQTGGLVWESSGEGTIATEDIREFRIPFEIIAHRLWGGILKDLGVNIEYSKKWFGEED